MSHRTFNRDWERADEEIRDLLAYENSDNPLLQPGKTYEDKFNHLACLYIKYVQIFRKLSVCYDQLVHPQKRRVLKLMLDGVTGRVLELKHALVELDSSDFHYFDSILSDLKLTPEDIDIETPAFYKRDNARMLKEREKVLVELEAQYMKKYDAEAARASEQPLTREAAILLLQSHERARQGRLRAKFMMDIKEQERRDRLKLEQQRLGVPEIKPDADEAATTIQRHLRGMLTRKHLSAHKENEDILIGLCHNPKPPKRKEQPGYKAKKIEEARRLTQAQYEHQYQASLVHTKMKIAQVEGPEMKEKLSDKIREWFLQCREQTGKFPDMPSEEGGGSKTIFNPPPKEEEESAAASAKGKKGAKKSATGKKKSADAKKSAKGKGDKKKKKGEEEEEDPGPQKSIFQPMLEKASEQYGGVWKLNAADKTNVHQKHDLDMIREIKRKEVEEELRLEVDELMRQELENLKAAVDADKKAKKGKGKGKGKGKKGKGKKGKGKGKKGKGKGKKGKGKGGKKEKDLTAGVNINVLYEELVRNGIVKRVPELPMDSIVGNFSFLGSHRLAKRQAAGDKSLYPEPVSLFDVRRVLTQYCMLPLGSQAVHETQPVHVKSVMLTGSHGTGKTTFAMAAAHELGANFFDLSPSNTAGKYTAKKGVDGVEGMIHKVFKVAKHFQPSIIFIGQAASVFLKKKPKTDTFECTRMKKELPKAIKSMKPGERIFVIGVDDRPFDAEMKDLASVFQKILLVPPPDYGTRLALWFKFLDENGAKRLNQLDLSALAKISDGYTASDIEFAVKKVLTAMRRKQQSIKTLSESEFVQPLAQREPLYVEEQKQFHDWLDKTPLGKKRAKFLTGDTGEDEGDSKDKKKTKKKKK